MRRAIALLLVALVVAGVVVATPSQSADEYRVDVIFDDARGLVPGQLVQVAGARVGTVDSVSITRDYKARLHLKVDRRFAPFRKDAQCTIKPQGLIAENYVECDPGSPDAASLRGKGDHAPTVPVDQTTQPVAITDLFEIWDAPTRDRLQILLSTLGIATAARGEDINGILRRANPTLQLARRTIGLLERQKTELATIVDATDKVAADLSKQPEEITRFAKRAASVTTETAEHRAALGESLRRLPALLREARPALQRLDATMEAGQPLLTELEAAAPHVNRLSGDLPRLAKAGAPALAAMAPVLARGAETARRAGPFMDLVQQYAAQALPSSKTAGVMFKTLEERGFNQTFLEFLYNGALAAARYDGTSHMLPAHVTLSDCGLYATAPVKGCGSAFPANGEKRTAAEEDDERKKREKDRKDEEADDPAGTRRTTPAPAPDAVAPETSTPEAETPVPVGPDQPEQPTPVPLPETPTPAAPQVPGAPQPSGGGEGNVVSDLLDYLLG